MRMAILTNGGDTCVLNATVENIKRSALDLTAVTQVYGVKYGYQGLIDGELEPITRVPLDLRQGGCRLGVSRSSPCVKSDQGWEINDGELRKMMHTLASYDIDILVVIGGDGTLNATKMACATLGQEGEVQIIGFLKTIDNDVRTFTSDGAVEAALCPGYPSAVEKLFQCVKDLGTTAETCRRAFTVETMGRDAGWLVAATALGGAQIVLIPEVPIYGETVELLKERIKHTYSLDQYVIVGVSEGIWWDADDESLKDRLGQPRKLPDGKKVAQFVTDELGPRKLGGAGVSVARKINEWFPEMDARCHHTDYLPRSGSPSKYDLKLVETLGRKVGQFIALGTTGVFPSLERIQPYDQMCDGSVSQVNLESVEQKLYPAPDYYDEQKLCVKDNFIYVLRTIVMKPRV